VDDILVYSKNRGASNTCECHPAPSESQRFGCPPKQMHLCCLQGRIPWLRDLWVWHTPPSEQGRRGQRVPDTDHSEGPAAVHRHGELLSPLPAWHWDHNGTSVRSPDRQVKNAFVGLRSATRLFRHEKGSGKLNHIFVPTPWPSPRASTDAIATLSLELAWSRGTSLSNLSVPSAANYDHWRENTVPSTENC